MKMSAAIESCAVPHAHLAQYEMVPYRQGALRSWRVPSAFIDDTETLLGHEHRDRANFDLPMEQRLLRLVERTFETQTRAEVRRPARVVDAERARVGIHRVVADRR